MSQVSLPLPWWRLPFAGALILHGSVIKRCQLCRIQLCQSKAINDMPTGCHVHWFNRLQFICQDCHERVTWCHSTFKIDSGRDSQDIEGVASTAYTFPFDDAMRRYKNSQELSTLPILVHVLRQLAPPPYCHHKNSIILPVPTTNTRIKERGFAPLWWLALYLSFHWQIPIFTGIQRDERAHQQGLSREERLQNVSDAFHLTDIPSVQNILLFDDVVTTGATMQSIIEQLYSVNANYRIEGYSLLHGKK